MRAILTAYSAAASLLGLVLLLCVQTADADTALPWSALVDQQAQVFEDPFADLTDEQMDDLLTVVRTRARLAVSEFTEAERKKLQALEQDATAYLAETGVDVDWLLAQRWAVAERREKAAWAGNTVLDGQKITLSGYVIPAPAAEDGSSVAYLVPEAGMCSHMPPPPPNQMVRMTFPGDWNPTMIYEPVKVTGTLTVVRSEHEVLVIDGMVPMQAAFTMHISRVQSLLADEPTGPERNSWADQIADRLRAIHGAAPETN